MSDSEKSRQSDKSGLSSSKISQTGDTFTKESQHSTLSSTNNSTSMQGSNWSNTTELESTNASFTDVTSTLLSSSTLTETDVEKSRIITRDLLLKKQLLHDVQKLKIEISQKDLLIDTLKADNLNRIDDLEDQLSDEVHAKQLLTSKYENKIAMLREDTGNKIRSLKKDLQDAIKIKSDFQLKFEKEQNKISNAKETFVDIQLEEDEYLEIKGKPQEELAPYHLYAIRLYESIRPLKVQNETLLQRIDLITSDLKDREDEVAQERQELEEERKVRAELDVRCQRFQVQIEDLRAQLSHRTYKNQNFDIIQSERDSLDRKITDYERSCMVYKAELDNKTKEMETQRIQLLEQKQTIALLQQDKDYLSKQIHELLPRYNLIEEHYQQTCQQLDEVKCAREELYEKFLNSREHFKREYEDRLKNELNEITTKTNNELCKIKESTTEMYERENRNLRDSKNAAVLEQERLASNERELQLKFNELLGEFRQSQISSDSKVAECQSEMKMKTFELDRVHLLHEESLNNVKQMSSQNDLLSKKLEALNKEYYSLKGSSDRKMTEIGGKNEEMKSKLEIYEKLEQELDDVVMQAAEITDEGDAERVLFAYGYGANVPSTAKRRMQQSVHLARRVLQLERANTSLKHDIERETKKRQQLAEELQNATSLLNEAQQPYNYLIESIRTRDEQNKSLKNVICTLEKDISCLKKDFADTTTSNKQMTMDLERLLNQREEMSVLKQVVLGLKSQDDLSVKKVGKTATTVFGPHASSRTSLRESDLHTFVEKKPVVFTNAEAPAWYKKLKQKNNFKESR